jgi:hypothetical protein
MKKSISFFSITIAMLACARPMFCQSGFATDTEVVAPDPAQWGQVGRVVAISGDTAVAGANGAAYVYVRQDEGWMFQQKLVASDIGHGPDTSVNWSAFGAAVALDGKDLAVGAPGLGAVFVFGRAGTGWVQRTVINLPPFEYSLALQKGTLVIGVVETIAGSPNVGMAYVFRRYRGVWRQDARLTTTAAFVRRMDISIGLDGNNVVVGSKGVFVFHRTEQGWVREASTAAHKLCASGSDRGRHSRCGRPVVGS